jgi:tRNA modification GTPase
MSSPQNHPSPSTAKPTSPHPIIAIATAAGRGGVGIVRLSGGSGAALLALAQQLTGKALSPRHATLAAFTAANGSVIDQGLALWFPAPHSYTGEDVLELQGHGGPVVLQLLLKRCMALGAAAGIGLRLAQPGEFTQRAFLNGQLDLAQAESVADLIEASTEAAATAASNALSGAFSKEVHALVHGLTQLRMLVEATLDFPEEEIEFLQKADALGQLERLQAQLLRVIATTQQGALLRDGLRVVLVGAPNVGKSSLLNALAGQDVAIVTAIAGTTRDTITQTIHLNGVPLDVIDTAGLRETTDEVERLGIARTWAQIHKAHVVVKLRDAVQPESEVAIDLPAHLPVVNVLNKVDLLEGAPSDWLNRIVPDDTAKGSIYAISAKTGAGLDALKAALLRIAGWQGNAGGEGLYIARERHIIALHAAQAQLDAAADCAAMGDKALDLFAECLRLSQQALGDITGEFTSDDLLGVIFGQFCIGK